MMLSAYLDRSAPHPSKPPPKRRMPAARRALHHNVGALEAAGRVHGRRWRAAQAAVASDSHLPLKAVVVKFRAATAPFWRVAMLRRMLEGRNFDPKAVAILVEAFEGIVDELY